MGVLRGHALAFHKVGYRDGSGKCDIVASENRTVYGALFMLAEAELPALDVHEGVGEGYERRATRILNERGHPIDAWTYVATRTDPSLRPYTWYKRHVLEGAREARLPLAYLHMIELTAAIEDPDAERARGELSLYG